MRSHSAARYYLLLALAAALGACAGAPERTTPWHGALTSGSEFGITVGASAANAQDVMWAQGYGFEGAVSCSAPAVPGCHAGEQVLSFQPLEMGKHGHVYLKIESGRVSAIAWALTPVAYSEG